MQIVIDIPEDVRNRIAFGVTYEQDLQIIVEAIANGTPLPKGHGDLIDRNALNFHDIDEANYGSNYIRIAPTIIEADKESKG